MQDVKNQLFDNGFGGNTIDPVAYNGDGVYQPFLGINDGRGGGGGTYIPPTPPNPTFVPPSYMDEGSLKVNLLSNEAAEFFDNDNSVGIGVSSTLVYSPATTFGSSRTYMAYVNGKKPSNYYVVSVQKAYQTPKFVYEDYWMNDRNNSLYSSMFIGFTGYNGFGGFNGNQNGLFNWNYNFSPSLTSNDVKYTESLNITEFVFSDEGTNARAANINSLEKTTGTISLEFKFNSIPTPKPDDPTPVSKNINYEVAFDSNFQNELGDILSLKYDIVVGQDIIETNSVLLTNGNTDGKYISEDILKKGEVIFTIEGNLPSDYSYTNIYYATKSTALKTTDFSQWNEISQPFKLPANQLNGGIVIYVKIEKVLQYAKPSITLYQTKYDVEVKDSDTDKVVKLPFSSMDMDFVDVYIAADKIFRIQASNNNIPLSFKNDYGGVYGTKKIYIVPISNLYGTGDRVEVLINFIAVNDYPSITEVIHASDIVIPSFSDLNIDFDVQYNSFAATSVDVDLIDKGGDIINLFKNLPPNGVFNLNLRDLSTKFPKWNGNTQLILGFTPYNRGGENELKGNLYEVLTNIAYPTLHLDEDIIKKSIFDAFVQNLSINEPSKDSKYLTHLVNFGNDEQIIISSFEEDNWSLSKKSEDELGNMMVKPEDEIKSIIVRLYTPLPANITENSTLWITKLMSNPLIETIILSEQDSLSCPPIKGPNFSIDVDFVSGNSTNYESLDDLILSGSTSSNELINTYLSSSIMDVDDLNIQYTDGSSYIWENFIHFSSAKERVNNFIYKIQLIELYEQNIANSQTSSWVNTIASQQDVERQTTKKNQVIQGFDGFEKFLYTPSSFTLSTVDSLTWPHAGNNRLLSNSNVITNWYNNLIDLAESYDIENPDWVQNNVPQYIVNNNENESLLLFLSMIGQHFDNIYFHGKAIERSRGMGYQSKNNMSDKLLFDALKSMSWDAKNLASDSHLWEYVFGKDKNGNDKFVNPAKQRTYEVWRRIANNLPYLLKHKGTKRGIYALMSCYGIPASNLSILEFGGPEVTNDSKGKLVIDNITTALVMNTGSYLDFNWKSTDKGRKPNTIEMFVKPAFGNQWNVISGSGWNVQLSGSSNSDYGKVIFNYSGSTNISSSLLPIFNGRYFGISVSSGSEGLKLDLRQSDKERTIFESSTTINDLTNWNNGSTITLGKSYSGSVDEFRLWSEQLNTQIFYNHVSFPEMINGNSVSSSTHDLHLRLDFEYPKNLAVSQSLINVDTNIYFANGLTRNHYENGTTASLYSTNPSSSLYVSASQFTNISTYPYNFEIVDRMVVMDYPDGGASRYSTNKVRFESQTDFNGNDVSGGVDLSIKSRVTKKAFDQSPTDSNRVGLFFSPTKELNIDIAKSFGGLNIDNYIGDPSDFYKSNYKSLDSLRNYYFQRFDGRDIYAYINLIKLYEKSMFEDIKKMLPARVKATTGLLIEPHFLERSKVAHKKPSGENNQYQTDIHFGDTSTIIADNNQYEVTLTSSLFENIFGENNQYETTIYTGSLQSIIAENYQHTTSIDFNNNLIPTADYYQKEVDINAELGNATILSEIELQNSNTIVGQSNYEEIGFGLYAQRGVALRTYYNKDNVLTKERVKVNLVTTQKRRDIIVFNFAPNGVGDPRGGYHVTSSVYNETELNIQPFSGSTPPVVTGNIISVNPVDGYLPTHNKYTSDLTTGLKNSYYLGSKNTAATTLDGTSPIETFATNPNTLKVNKTGRAANEPILEVE